MVKFAAEHVHPMKPSVSTAHWLIIALCAFGTTALCTTAWAANIGVGSGIRVERPLRSMKDLRDANVIKQQFDYSCGAAALATILRYGLGDAVTERDVLMQLFGLLSAEELPVTLSQGFSLLHLQRVAQARSYRAEGFRIEPRYLSQLSGPVIVFIQPRGYKHFAVLRGIKDDRVFLADPSLGNIRMPMYRFLESWLDESGTGIIFVVEPTAGAASRHHASDAVHPGIAPTRDHDRPRTARGRQPIPHIARTFEVGRCSSTQQPTRRGGGFWEPLFLCAP